MGLIFPNRREDIVKDKPGTHALIVGVSAYPHLEGGSGKRGENTFGLKQLSASALSAYRIHEWIVQQRERFRPPLASCRLLLSPTKKDLIQIRKDRDEDFLSRVGAANLENFTEQADQWRDDASGHKENMTFFYFAGHGLETAQTDAALLLEDFNRSGGALKYSVDINNIYQGMSPTSQRPDLARRQIYFVDACRFRPGELKELQHLQPTDVFTTRFESDDDNRPIVVDDRSAPLIYAAVPGALAYSALNEQTFFSQAVLACLRGRAGVKVENEYGQTEWQVSAHSISAALKVVLIEISEERKLPLDHTIAGKDLTILTLDGAPSADVVIDIDPEDARKLAMVEVLDEGNSRVWQVIPRSQPYPSRRPLPPGKYNLNAVINPRTLPYVDVVGQTRNAKPPLTEWKIKVTNK